MRLIFFLLYFNLSAAAIAQSSNKKQDEVCYNPNLLKDTTKKSIKSMALGVIGKDSVKISYHSPGVRGRIIWGGLVPFDEVWVTGAHDATNLVIDKPFVINGKEISPGKYAFFTIPGKKEWTVILNKKWEQHLTNEYDSIDDIVRIRVKPKKNSHTERLQYFIENSKGSQGVIAMQWEKIRIEIPILIK